MQLYIFYQEELHLGTENVESVKVLTWGKGEIFFRRACSLENGHLIEGILLELVNCPTPTHEVAYRHSKKQPVRDFVKRSLDLCGLRAATHNNNSKFSIQYFSSIIQKKLQRHKGQLLLRRIKGYISQLGQISEVGPHPPLKSKQWEEKPELARQSTTASEPATGREKQAAGHSPRGAHLNRETTPQGTEAQDIVAELIKS